MKPNLKLIFFLIVIGIITTSPTTTSWNVDSRMATIQSLVEKHTFIIDESDFIKTGDKVFINGHFYSDKLPTPQIIGAIIYWPLFQLGN